MSMRRLLVSGAFLDDAQLTRADAKADANVVLFDDGVCGALARTAQIQAVAFTIKEFGFSVFRRRK